MGWRFRLTLFLVAQGGIEPPTQEFSIFAPGRLLLHRFAAKVPLRPANLRQLVPCLTQSLH
jgi:hypothetical protein